MISEGNKKCLKMYNIFIPIVIIIVIYYVYMRAVYKEQEVPHNDMMNVKIIDLPILENCCSMWPISHLILFTIIGYLYPTCDAIAIGSGIAWEAIEVLLSFMFNKSDRQATRERDGTVEYSQSWWAGSMKDILMNIVGFYLGKIIRIYT